MRAYSELNKTSRGPPCHSPPLALRRRLTISPEVIVLESPFLEAIMAANLPLLITSLPGPRAQAVIARDQAVLSPSYTRSYPLVTERGERRHRRGRRRQPVPRLSMPVSPLWPPAIAHPRVVSGDSGAGRQIHPHVRHRLLLREHGPLAEKLADSRPETWRVASTSETPGLKPSRRR